MDYLRSCYRSEMRPYPDRPDVKVKGRWKFCLPDAKPVPFLHSFGSSVWDKTGQEISPLPGEIPGSLGYSKAKAKPGETGQKVCGNAELWLNGSAFSTAGKVQKNADGIPLCCNPPKVRPGIEVDIVGGEQHEGHLQPGQAEEADMVGGTQVNNPGYVSFGGCSNVPKILYFHVTSTTVLCNAWLGVRVTVFWNPTFNRFEGSIIHEGQTLTVHVLQGPGAVARLRLGCGGGLTFQSAFAPGCNPFLLDYSGPAGINMNCCVGTWEGKVTEQFYP